MVFFIAVNCALYCIKTIIEQLGILYSLKNIPIPSNEFHLIKLIEKIERIVKQMRREKTSGLNQKALHHNANIWKHSKRNF